MTLELPLEPAASFPSASPPDASSLSGPGVAGPDLPGAAPVASGSFPPTASRSERPATRPPRTTALVPERPADRRRHQRYGVAPLRCRISRTAATILDISLVGLAVESEEALPIGQRLPIEVPLPGGLFRFTVEVARCRMVGVRAKGLDRPPVYHSGLDFRHEIDHRAPELLGFIQDHILLTDPPVQGFLRTEQRGTLGRVETCSVLRLGSSRARVATPWPGKLGAKVGLTLQRGSEALSATARVLDVEARADGNELELDVEPLSCAARLTLRGWIRDLLE